MVKKANSVTLILPTGNPTDSYPKIDVATQLIRALMGNTKAIACDWHCPDQMETATKTERSSKG